MPTKTAAAKKTGVPHIDGLQGKVAVIERRIQFLARRLENPSYAASTSADFDKAEQSALEAAVEALQFVERVRPQQVRG